MSTTTEKDWGKSWPTETELKKALKESSQRELAAKHNVDRSTIANHIKGIKVQVAG